MGATETVEDVRDIGMIVVLAILAWVVLKAASSIGEGVDFTTDVASDTVDEFVEQSQDSGLMHDPIDAGMGDDSLVGAPPEVPVYDSHAEAAADDPIMAGTGLPLTDRVIDAVWGGGDDDSYQVDADKETRWDEPTRVGGGRVT